MDPEDLEPRRAAPKPKDLDALSIEELREYIAELEGEITRARAKIEQKQAHRTGAAAALFKGS
jgi:uncharacterized small protein (DUF1192 family)